MRRREFMMGVGASMLLALTRSISQVAIQHPRLLISGTDPFTGLPLLKTRYAMGRRPSDDMEGWALSWQLTRQEGFAERALAAMRAGHITKGVKPSRSWVDYARWSLAFDWRDNPAHPHHGGRYGVLVSQFHDQDLDAFDFHRVDIDLQQYVPLPNRYRLLAVRAAAVVTDSDANQHVPFYFQPTLGGAQTLRGFREFRFRDQSSLLFSAEYRWEAWWALDGALFVDAGTVAPTRRALSLGDMDVSYGIGFRFHSNGAVIGRLDLAFSREGFVPLLRFEHVF